MAASRFAGRQRAETWPLAGGALTAARGQKRPARVRVPQQVTRYLLEIAKTAKNGGAMALSPKETEELALLARLALKPDETERLAVELSKVLSYVEKLGELETKGIEPTTHAVPIDCPLREDIRAEGTPTEEALSQAPRRVESFFAVPKIIERT